MQWISEDDWFFRLSAYRDRLLEHFTRNPSGCAPRSVYNEMMAILDEGLDDLSISRTNFDWGIPIDGGGVIYVWFDALLNYITAIGWSEDEDRFAALLAGANAADRQRDRALSHDDLAGDAVGAGRARARARLRARLDHRRRPEDRQEPRQRGRSVRARRIVSAPIRCATFCLREAPFGSDFSYSEEKIAQRHNSDLGNDLGNLLQRTLSMLQRYRDGIVPRAPANAGASSAIASRDCAMRTRERILALRFREALEGVWELVTALNRTIDERKPWALHKEGRNDELDAVLYDLCEGLRWLAILLASVHAGANGERCGGSSAIRDASTRIGRRRCPLGRVAGGDANRNGAPLFPRVELVPQT